MASLLPAMIAPPNDSVEAQLEATLSRLPAEWTIVVERRIGGADGPYVPFVLLHRDIGMALVALKPSDLDAAIVALRALLMRAGINEPPIVAVTVAASEIGRIASLLAAAFAGVAPLAPADGRWPEAAVGLLMSAEDAPMAPLRPATVYEEVDEQHPPRSGLDRYGLLAATAVVAVILELVILPPGESVQPRYVGPVAHTIPLAPAASVETSTQPQQIAPEKQAAQVAGTPPSPAASGSHPANSLRRPTHRFGYAGNNRSAGRYYDADDKWLSRQWGVPLPGAPQLRNGGG